MLDESAYKVVVGLIQAGRVIEAIKEVRAATNAGLKEAKDFVDALRALPPMVGKSASGATSPQEDDPSEELRELLRRGQKIEAIKRHRERTGLGLKDAKDAVEAIEAQMAGRDLHGR